MNRPAENLRLAEIADGIAHFKKISKTAMWLEIFIARGVNDSRESALRFRELVRKIVPDKVQLNTLDRPGTEHNVEIPSPETMNMMAEIIREAAPVELIGGWNMGFGLLVSDCDKGPRADQSLSLSTVPGKGCYNAPHTWPIAVFANK